MPIYVAAFGHFRVTLDDRELPLGSFKQQCALLTYLAVERQSTRDKLVDLFWPEKIPARGRHSLAQAIYRLRQTTGARWLRVDGDVFSVTDELTADATEFEAAVTRGDNATAVSLYRGEFVDGLYLWETQPLQEWQELQRAHYSRLHRKARRELLKDLESAGDSSSALRIAREWVAIQPADDEANHHLIRLLAATGADVDALEQYEAYVHLLKPDGLRPLDDTETIIKQVRAQIQLADAPHLSGKEHRTALTTRTEESRKRKWYARPRVRKYAQRVMLGTVALFLSSFATEMVSVRGVFGRVGETLGITIDGRCSDGSIPPCSRQPPLDPNAYVVLPLRHAAGAQPGLDGELCARLIEEAIGRWSDIHVVDPARVHDVLARFQANRKGRPVSVKDALDIARELGSGNLLIGEVWGFADTTRVRAVLYDVSRRSERASHTTRVSSRALDARSFQDLADSILVRGARLEVPPDARVVTTSMHAWLEYDLGMKALARWSVDSASLHFQKSLKREPDFALAHLWLAHIAVWQGDTTDAWRLHARRAGELRHRLPARERNWAAAQASLADRRYQQACEDYRAALRRDSLDFIAWFGLGECQARDDAVVPDPRSSTGWSFRSSWHSAATAYQRARDLAPAINFFYRELSSARLPGVLRMNASTMRRGQIVDADSIQFLAYPSLQADTFAFVPDRYSLVMAAQRPVSRFAAVARSREIMRRSAQQWVEAFPNSADAHQALARALEFVGEIRPTQARNASAVSAAARARILATAEQPEKQIPLAALHVRVLLKAEDFTSAAAVARTAVNRWSNANADDVEYLAALAALTGQMHRSARLMSSAAVSWQTRSRDGKLIRPPQQIGEAALSYYVYAAFGAPLDSLLEMRRRLNLLLASQIALEEIKNVKSSLYVDRADGMAYPILRGMWADTTYYFTALYFAIGRGQRDAARARLQRADSAWATTGQGVGDVDLSRLYHDSRFRIALGDTATAIAQMDALLNALWTINPPHLNVTDQVVSLVRIMGLRAQLAARQNDRRTARKWASAVVALWGEGDRELRPFVTSMRRLAE